MAMTHVVRFLSVETSSFRDLATILTTLSFAQRIATSNGQVCISRVHSQHCLSSESRRLVHTRNVPHTLYLHHTPPQMDGNHSASVRAATEDAQQRIAFLLQSLRGPANSTKIAYFYKDNRLAEP
eukprot:Blabericola_migrator_1__5855@NODE_2967_length_2155_cov_4_952107_g1857_i0_p2_GENE_NODE_2967_length_2155_cov_4_952107_g1857_i0NODE_2967_length_2155_cov_4_952107_g1857_i0_p2_ORF_typecomplete_len125_score12_53CDtoxinA/PF03498_14/0_086_NODE_2967_length_2155_cov_4_952107_g1857_i0508882